MDPSSLPEVLLKQLKGEEETIFIK
ncbi:hypothetical protein Avbf_18178 [Armadillidium vulgare]|nr:hypothetical protein Avbf_18178 [Armadillidium vulgare]